MTDDTVEAVTTRLFESGLMSLAPRQKRIVAVVLMESALDDEAGPDAACADCGKTDVALMTVLPGQMTDRELVAGVPVRTCAACREKRPEH